MAARTSERRNVVTPAPTTSTANSAVKFPGLEGEVAIAVMLRVAVVDVGVDVPIGVPLNVTLLVSDLLFGALGSISATS